MTGDASKRKIRHWVDRGEFSSFTSAIRRDYERKKGTLEPVETLDQSVRAFHAAAAQLVQEARQVLERVGPLQEIGMRLSRIESAIGGRAVR